MPFNYVKRAFKNLFNEKIMLSSEEKEQIRIIQNEYARQWRKNNPEKVQEIRERFWKNKLKNNRKDDI